MKHSVAPENSFPRVCRVGQGRPLCIENVKFYDRTLDLIHKYNPTLIYFDDTVFPLWPISDV